MSSGTYSTTFAVLTVCTVALTVTWAIATPLSGPTCPCRERASTSVSICARPNGDPAWCTYHICAVGYDCVDASQATHTCVVFTTKGKHECLRDGAGSIIKPNPGDKGLCKCEYIAENVRHIMPRIEL